MTTGRFFRIAFLICFAAYISFCSAVYLFQDRVIFQPSTIPQSYLFSEYDPLGGKELWLEPEEGIRLNALHFVSSKSKGVVLFFNGQGGTLRNVGTTANFFIKNGYDFFAFDYRSFGKSTGKLSEEALFADGKYVLNFLRQRYNEGHIIVYGASLGTGPAIHTASYENLRLLILRSPYFSMEELARRKFPWLPVKYLLKYPLHSGEYIKNIHAPVLIFHGTLDKVIPSYHTELLAQNAMSPVHVVSVEGADHGDVEQSDIFRNALSTELQKSEDSAK